MAEHDSAPGAFAMWSAPAGPGRVDLHLRVTLADGPTVLVIHARRDEVRAFAQGILADAGDGFERTLSAEATHA